jgi:hypothetical protein
MTSIQVSYLEKATLLSWVTGIKTLWLETRVTYNHCLSCYYHISPFANSRISSELYILNGRGKLFVHWTRQFYIELLLSWHRYQYSRDLGKLGRLVL